MAFFLPLTLQPCGRVAMPAKHVTSHHSCRWIFIAGFHVFFPVFSVSFFFSGCISHQVPVRAYWHSRVPKDLPEHAWAPPPFWQEWACNTHPSPGQTPVAKGRLSHWPSPNTPSQRAESSHTHRSVARRRPRACQPSTDVLAFCSVHVIATFSHHMV